MQQQCTIPLKVWNTSENLVDKTKKLLLAGSSLVTPCFEAAEEYVTVYHKCPSARLNSPVLCHISCCHTMIERPVASFVLGFACKLHW